MTCHPPPPPTPSYCIPYQPHPHPPRPVQPQPSPSPPPPPPLILKECKITAHIVDVHSYVTIAQKFHNQSNLHANQLTYTFSVLAGAAICGFEMVREHGKNVIGIVKDKDSAQKELNAALASGHTVALGEEQTKDLFSISIGNALPNEIITIQLSYINPLIDDESKYRERFKPQLRFTLPRAYMQRWGQAPTGKITSGVGHEDVPFTMDVSIQQAGRIRSVSTSSGFSASVDLGRPPNVGASAGPEENFATVNLRRSNVSTPSTDVVLVITADGLDTPRAFIEPHPSSDRGTTAIGLTLVPQLNPIESPNGMEFIALVDRSNSMAGVKLQMTQAALKVLLKGLPTKKSFFNIYSYGTKVDSLWAEGRVYDDFAVEKAISYIDGMKADYGGTDIAKALTTVFNSLPSPLVRPVSIFLLTDGGAWDVKECMAKTEAAIRQRSTGTNFLRVFTVGLGDGVSTETCDGIARAGGGMSTYIVTAEEEFMGKCSRLVMAARMAPVTNIKVSWEDPDDPIEESDGPVDIIQPDFQFSTDVGATVRTQQAPMTIPSFFPATRLDLFAIVPKGTATRRSFITVTGHIAATNRSLNPIKIPVCKLMHSPGKTFIHTSAAKALITDLEDGKTTGMPQELKEDIVRTGTKYGLTSRYTSFIAVDNGQATPYPVGVGHHVFSAVTLERSTASSGAASGGFAPISLFAQHPGAGAGLKKNSDGDAASQDGGDERQAGDPAVLFELATLQRVDGGFGSNASSVIRLLLPMCGVSAYPVLEKHHVGEEVTAVLLAWAWMVLCCGFEAHGLREKADSWLRENVKGVDVDAVQRELCEGVKFRSV